MFKRPAVNAPPDVLIFGLGNPGPRYSSTRHNAGWWALDALTQSHKVIRRLSKSHGQAEFVSLDGPEGPLNTALIRPATFMNLSGNCVREWRAAYPKALMIVVYDDIALPPGKLRLREKSSAGGHNGIKSIIAALGSDEFPRLKIGVGAPGAGEDSAEYVLEPPTQSEREAIFRSLPVAARVLEALAAGDANQAQRLIAQYEESLKPKPEPKPEAKPEPKPRPVEQAGSKPAAAPEPILPDSAGES